MAQTWDELEGVVAQGMGRVKALQPYARKPYITNVLYAVMAFPFVLLLGPLLLAIGEPPPSCMPRGYAAAPCTAGMHNGIHPSRAQRLGFGLVDVCSNVRPESGTTASSA